LIIKKFANPLIFSCYSLRDDKIYSIPPQMGLQEFFRKDGKFYEDARSAGKFSNNYIWEENLGDASS